MLPEVLMRIIAMIYIGDVCSDDFIGNDDNDDDITQSIDSLKVHPEDYRGDNGIFGLSL